MKNHLVTVVDRARAGFKRTWSGSSADAEREDSRTSHLPPELWLCVFTHLSSHTDLRAVSLTCQAFRYLAQPLLFSRICTHAPLRRHGLRWARTRSPTTTTTQRLAFFFSPHIAPAVREVCIDPQAQAEDDPDEDPTDVVIDTIFDDGLARFPNLSTLTCRSLRLTPRRLAGLHRLLGLTSLTLDDCRSDITEFAFSAMAQTPLPLVSVAFKYSTDDESLQTLLPLFLSPKHLYRLSSTTTQIIPALAGAPRPFAKLQHLEIPVWTLPHPLFLPALKQCPALERLALLTDPTTTTEQSPPSLPRTGVPSTLPSNILPLLKSYRGPRTFAALFAGRPTARVTAVELSGVVKASRLTRTLRSLPRNLDSLSFRLDAAAEVPPTLLSTLHASFPALRTLSINEPALTSTTLLTLLSTAAHLRTYPTLRVLRIRVSGKDRYNLWVPPLEEAADAREVFSRAKEELGRVYPGLVTLKFMYGGEGASMVWRAVARGGGKEGKENGGKEGKEKERKELVLVSG
ncbi:hypothetical protein C8F01DRAFT_1262515 [Mycena amicta]|nr:hypothetical protein C8F01DRAFT_1262515 [Mycena amicta]